MNHTHCLNCGKGLSDKYCAGCGQKADTHRISFKHFVLHDLLHGTFHIDKGMLYTARQALVRPGQAALDYIAGKRIRYYNVFYLILITIGVMLFTRHILGMFNEQAGYIMPEKVYINEASRKLDAIFAQGKFVILIFVPLGAINSFILFRRKKLNLSEHAILSGIVLLGILLQGTASNIYFPFNHLFNFNDNIASIVVAVIINAYVVYAYCNAFAAGYSGLGMAYRILLFYALLCAELYILFLIVFGFISHWKFGQITVSPFS